MHYALQARQLSDKIRAIIDILELEDLGGKHRVRIGTKYLEANEAKPKVKGRWPTAAFEVPTLCTDRPTTSDGRRPIHFTLRPISKSAQVKGQSRTKSEQTVTSADAALENELYISRDARADAVVQFDEYVSRQFNAGAVDDVGLVISNIHADKAKRVEYWRAVARCETQGGPDRPVLNLNRLSKAEVRALIAALPDDEAALQGIAAALDEPMRGGRYRPFALPEPIFEKLVETCKAIGAWDEKKPPLYVAKGRAGRVQSRTETEFPDGIDGAARARIAHGYCAVLNSRGYMFTAAIHAPDSHNDKRNYHLHVAMHDRPARFLDDKNCWDFEYLQDEPGQRRKHRPLRQNKIRFGERKGEEPGEVDPNLCVFLRRLWSDLCNKELEAANKTLRFDHRSYVALEIDCEPGQHLWQGASQLELRGVPTVVGIRNAEKRWEARWRADDARLAKERSARDLLAGAGSTAITDLRAAGAADVDIVRITEALTRFGAVSASVDMAQPEVLRLIRLYEAAFSRSYRTGNYCQRQIDALVGETQTASGSKNLQRYQARCAEAEQFADLVDQVLGGTEKVNLISEACEGELNQLREAAATLRQCLNEVPTLIRAATASRYQGQTATIESSVLAPTTTSAPAQPTPTQAQTPPVPPPSWTVEQVFEKIVGENMEIMPPDAQRPVYRVPGLPRVLLDVIRDDQRAQSRLAGICAAREREAAERAEAKAKKDKEYEDLKADAKAKSDAMRNAAFEEFLSLIRDLEVSPIKIKKNRTDLDVSALPEEWRHFGECFQDRKEVCDVIAAIYAQVADGVARELRQRPKELIDAYTGHPIPDRFPDRLRPHVIDLMNFDASVRVCVSLAASRIVAAANRQSRPASVAANVSPRAQQTVSPAPANVISPPTVSSPSNTTAPCAPTVAAQAWHMLQRGRGR